MKSSFLLGHMTTCCRGRFNLQVGKYRHKVLTKLDDGNSWAERPRAAYLPLRVVVVVVVVVMTQTAMFVQLSDVCMYLTNYVVSFSNLTRALNNENGYLRGLNRCGLSWLENVPDLYVEEQ